MTFTAQDLVHAIEIQSAALPLSLPALPGLSMAVRAYSSQGIGGDFCLAFPPRDHGRQPNRLGLALGDVSGKGLPAALIATSIGHLLPWLDPLADPGQALQALNRDLLERTPNDFYATAVLVELDLGEGRLRLWSAGHPPALIWRASTGGVQIAQCRNLPLGCFSDWQGQPEEWVWDEDDVLVLYSDGLMETRNSAGAMFGVEGLANALHQCADGDVDSIAETLIATASDWGTIADDRSVIACRRTSVLPSGMMLPSGTVMPSPVRVLLVDDHEIWREGMRSILDDSEFTVVGEAASGSEALETVLRIKPDLVLLDIRMADGDGFSALRAIKVQRPQTAVVMLSTYDQPGRMARAREGGATGYLLKGTPREELLASLRAMKSVIPWISGADRPCDNDGSR